MRIKTIEEADSPKGNDKKKSKSKGKNNAKTKAGSSAAQAYGLLRSE
jgi:hypothetical protein